MSTLKRQRKEIDYKEKSSSDDEGYKLPTSTSDWGEKEVKHFNVEFDEMHANNSIDKLPNIYKHLILEGWDEDDIRGADTSALNNTSKDVIKRLRGIMGLQKNEVNKEVKVDAFIYYLFAKLGFNDYPFEMFAQYECSIDIDKRTFTSRPDFIIFKDDIMTIILEDKHRFNANKFNDWGEHQTIGEIITCATHAIGTRDATETFIINAVRVVGTYFTFYKAEICSENIIKCYKSKSDSALIIKRYPKKDAPGSLSALNFCNYKDRVKIFKTIHSLL